MIFNLNSGKSLAIGKKTLIMAILNVTPDSFSDGGKFNRVDTAKRQVEELIAVGADIIDIGAESTRPGFTPITADEEISRLEPILKVIAKDCPIPLSVDTYKSKTAEVAIILVLTLSMISTVCNTKLNRLQWQKLQLSTMFR